MQVTSSRALRSLDGALQGSSTEDLWLSCQGRFGQVALVLVVMLMYLFYIMSQAPIAPLFVKGAGTSILNSNDVL